MTREMLFSRCAHHHSDPYRHCRVHHLHESHRHGHGARYSGCDHRCTPTTGGMPTTGGESSKPNNTMVIVIAILATLGVLAAFGVGLRQARKT